MTTFGIFGVILVGVIVVALVLYFAPTLSKPE